MIHIFVINYFAGNETLARSIRQHLSQRKDLRYFVFNTVRAGYEREISKKIKKYFEDERLRFYCCGGSGTMRNMLDGFDEADLAKIEVAFFPCGLTNDFLKNFDNEENFRDLDKLIDGKVVKVDYIRTNHGIAINTLSVGYDSNVEKSMKMYRVYDVFSSMLPYIMAVFKGIIFAQSDEIEVVIDGIPSSERYVEIVYGNGAVLGGNLYIAEKSHIQDGIASYLTVSNINAFEAFSILNNIMNKRISSIKKNVKHGRCRTMEIKRLDGKPIYINFDGELVECGTSCKAEIVQRGLNFVVPQETNIMEYTLN